MLGCGKCCVESGARCFVPGDAVQVRARGVVHVLGGGRQGCERGGGGVVVGVGGARVVHVAELEFVGL